MKMRSIIKRKDEWQLQQKIPRTEKTKFDSENLQIFGKIADTAKGRQLYEIINEVHT